MDWSVPDENSRHVYPIDEQMLAQKSLQNVCLTLNGWQMTELSLFHNAHNGAKLFYKFISFIYI